MAFKDNLREKIRIDRLANQARDSLGPPESGRKIDKTAMRNLLKTAGYQMRNEREMELYAQQFTDGKEKILVLDNELKVYDTTLGDVLLRKNPYTREMVRIRNIKKILNDQDVLVTRGTDTIENLRHECLADLDLSYMAGDIDDICNDGIDALEHARTKQVVDVLDMFAELLQLSPPPKSAAISDLEIWGWKNEQTDETAAYGPVIIYIRSNNRLVMFEQPLSHSAMEKAGTYKELAYGENTPALEGNEVFDALKKQILSSAGTRVPID